MIHDHAIGDAKITGVIEYSGPTHAPEFLYPAVDKAERDAVLKANASWLAPHHYAPNIDRLIVTIQLWVLRAGGNVIVIDTGVGNRKERAAAVRDLRLPTPVSMMITFPPACTTQSWIVTISRSMPGA